MTKNFFKIRESLDMNQSEFARELGVAQSHISRIENGSKKMSLKLIIRLKRILAKKRGIVLDLNDFLS